MGWPDQWWSTVQAPSSKGGNRLSTYVEYYLMKIGAYVTYCALQVSLLSVGYGWVALCWSRQEVKAGGYWVLSGLLIYYSVCTYESSLWLGFGSEGPLGLCLTIDMFQVEFKACLTVYWKSKNNHYSLQLPPLRAWGPLSAKSSESAFSYPTGCNSGEVARVVYQTMSLNLSWGFWVFIVKLLYPVRGVNQVLGRLPGIFIN